jgi:hypothetical protein
MGLDASAEHGRLGCARLRNLVEVREPLVRVVAWRPASERGVLDAYMSSYFNAWLDNQNLYSGPKRVVAAFVPRLVAEADSVERFFAAYPDGRLISIVRDPRSWFASARTHRHAFADPIDAVPRWRRSVEAALETKESFGDRVVLLTFESLVVRTEETMSRLADALGLTMVPQLLEPTYNGLPIRANSSDPSVTNGVRPERASSYREALADVTMAQTDGLAGDLYERTLERSLA